MKITKDPQDHREQSVVGTDPKLDWATRELLAIARLVVLPGR
jgi:alkylhydroperoxidase/carboxymuconolactone decarboxylase family protein YurZ